MAEGDEETEAHIEVTKAGEAAVIVGVTAGSAVLSAVVLIAGIMVKWFRPLLVLLVPGWLLTLPLWVFVPGGPSGDDAKWFIPNAAVFGSAGFYGGVTSLILRRRRKRNPPPEPPPIGGA